MQPEDEFNRILDSHVHPSDWVNPEPAEMYNMVVIGAGTAGLVTAAVAAGLGARVALIERERMGGDCLNVGCVPSKGLLAAARQIHSIRKISGSSIISGATMDTEVDFAAVMERMRRLRSSIAPDDSADRFRKLGVDVFFGQAEFIDTRSVRVVDKVLPFRKAVIATGARASAPPIPGLDSVPFLNNESIFSLTRLPSSLLVIGGGPIGVEMGQAFARLGSQVTLIESSDRILSREEEDAAMVVQDSLVNDGIIIHKNSTNLQFEPSSSDITYKLKTPEGEITGSSSHVLVAVGRAPNVENLGLENAGVEYDSTIGIHVNDHLQTSNRNIFAAGDVCSRYKFTHSADFMARTVISNALFFGRGRASRLVIPWATYSDPELAHVGLYPQEAKSLGISVTTITRHFNEVHRNILEDETKGFVRVHLKKGTDRILGATAVGHHAGELIAHITMAMTNKIGMSGLASTIHPYPTRSEIIRQLGDMYKRTRLTPTIASILKQILKWKR